MNTTDNKMIVGALEQCDLPELKIKALNIRVDTGAKTSSLHVDNIVASEQDGETWVSFDIHPDIHNVDRVVRRSAKVKSQRVIKSSNAAKEERFVIDTTICLGDRSWPIELTLTNRSNMSYLMLLGREAMMAKLLVDPSEEYLLGKIDEDNT